MVSPTVPYYTSRMPALTPPPKATYRLLKPALNHKRLVSRLDLTMISTRKEDIQRLLQKKSSLSINLMMRTNLIIKYMLLINNL
jgi:hypothetical protein